MLRGGGLSSGMASSSMPIPTTPDAPFGVLLRAWRQRRRRSQLDLSLDAEISQRHLSFIEGGRAMPSREVVLRLARHLELPLRERNALLVAAGHAPVFPRRPLGDPAMRAARDAVERVLAAYMPFPAVALDRDWTLVASNGAVAPLLSGADPALLVPPVNVLRLSLHPAGLAPRIANLPEWRAHLLERLGHQVALTADPGLLALLEELRGYQPGRMPGTEPDRAAVAVPLRLAVEGQGTLSFLSTTTVFGTPVDVTLSELFVEAFLPADTSTAEALRAMAEPARDSLAY